MDDTDNKEYTVKEVAYFLKVEPPTVYGWVRTGKVTPRRVGGSIRIPKDELRKVTNSTCGYDAIPS